MSLFLKSPFSPLPFEISQCSLDWYSSTSGHLGGFFLLFFSRLSFQVPFNPKSTGFHFLLPLLSRTVLIFPAPAPSASSGLSQHIPNRSRCSSKSKGRLRPRPLRTASSSGHRRTTCRTVLKLSSDAGSSGLRSAWEHLPSTVVI